MCDKIGERIDASDELLYRHVFPDWLQDGDQPSSQAFYPWRDADQGCLSVDRGSLTDAATAFALFCAPKPDGFGASASGTWALSASEVVTALVEPWCDPVLATDETPANPCHAVLEFAGVESRQWKKTGKRLKVFAVTRGRCA